VSLIQIAKVDGRIDRVPRGETPVVELQLERHQRVISMDLRYLLPINMERKTLDWRWTAYVETRL
jgi:hypothetical protein